MPRREPPVWLGVVLIVTLWALARPYVGLRHDGILYAGQALLHLVPKTMSQDIFFRFGSQDSFSVVSPLLAALYSRFGLDVVQFLVPTTSHVVLMGIAFRLMQPLAPVERWLGLAALAVLSHVYGGYGIFAFAERFVTGRTLSEPIALAALLALLARRKGLALLLAVLASALHPLVALPVWVIGWLLLCEEDRRWRWAAGALLVPVALGLTDVAPFGALFDRYDNVWWQAVVKANGQVLVSIWQVTDWQVVALDALVLALSMRLLPPEIARLARASLIAAAGLLLLSAIGADLLRVVLLTQLQVWRVLWVVHLLALLLLPAAAWALWRLGPAWRLPVAALGAAVVAVNARWELGWMFLLWAGVTLYLSASRAALDPRTTRLALWATGVAIVGLTVVSIARTLALLTAEFGTPDTPTLALLAFTAPALSLPLAFWALQVATRPGALRLAVTGMSLVSLGLAVVAWDRRSEWTRYVEMSLEREHPFSALIPPGAQVYWDGDLAATWLVLKRASYIHSAQGAGLLFNRATAVEYSRRKDAFEPLALQAHICMMMSKLNGEAHDHENCLPTEEVVADLCRTPAGPDFLVFQRAVGPGVVASWSHPGIDGRTTTFHLYDCSRLP